ncbi:MAG: CpsD/CapB family tyrosine-protein kinase [Candidatus Binataceae bacterium]
MQKRWRLGDDSLIKPDHGENNDTMPPLNQAAARLSEPWRNGFRAGDVSDAVTSRNALTIDRNALSAKGIGLETGGSSTRNAAYPPNGSGRKPLDSARSSRPWWRRLSGRTEAGRSLPALLAPGGEYAAGTAQFALLASRLQRWSAEQGKRVVLVTSAVAGEGKSFVAVNLAIILADLGSRVVLVDADLRTPALDRCLGLNPPQGLADYLAGDVELLECLYSTNMPRLTLLAAGKVAPSSARALADSRTRDCIQVLRSLEPPHLVLIDSPSILSAAEVQILASLTDAAMIVVAANRTPRAAVQNALRAINGASLFGIVFNRFELTLSASRAARTTPHVNSLSNNTNTTRRDAGSEGIRL